MQIRLLNQIQLDDQTEVVHQVFPVELTEKNGSLYLHYQNEEEEKVVLKMTRDELTMTRFSNPKSIMRFLVQQEAIVTIPTPMGIQHFVTKTDRYQFEPEAGKLALSYELRPLERDQVFARYQMEISWGD
ncbi:DUF1934 domain-containing protein [Streptococcus suis]|uniref:DUF1934 domain-containing protein n=1 Tax=Streptococcus suis TaxID=1307 RepID=A0A4T2GMH8_STRSU|nr:DUF1934 domain-containing protein [Streptococcus suis]MBM7268721.1 DUF1934 domain-containing protein [Streptococcus suis]MBM7269565.1 DUF1934 domain-containing protein [Streptococcus suis]MBM7313852.1 DUF1934 domain-containing protein [Streptococcus suis]MBO4107265.1 DUF1934 domain-containing protein [Streptococcus suis]